MKTSLSVVGAALVALGIFGCDNTPAEKQETSQVQSAQQTATVSMTDDQKFAYLLGAQFGVPPYLNVPQQIGEMLEYDAMVQGVVDVVKVYKDSTFSYQLDSLTMKKIDSDYAAVATSRAAAGDNAAPIKLAGPMTNQPVQLADTSSSIQKYSYMMGMQIGSMFIGVWRNFEQEFDVNYFVLGFREGISAEVDPNFKVSLPRDSIKAVNSRYVKRIQKIMDDRRQKQNGAAPAAP
ncbi:FKBP-type peptidyl-prolyl cis-trans isomerase N-terminal domain-containing protein [Fibrobacter sp.]|uniref:FKBP-type peptidyl-prolyl cis-trans isomerase N-terminal domain-containing protein n=1 Tax=Fibrobacter sp. TaxID=35828 RepID=UPI00388FBEA0